MSGIADRLAAVNARIEAACTRAGRDRSRVRLLAVAKMHPAEDVAEAVDAGQLQIGENYMQELIAKRESLDEQYGDTIEWHFIGQLQSKKVKQLVGRVDLIHSVDRIKLLDEIEKQAAKRGIIQHCLLEINVGDESSKGGTAESDAEALIEYARGLSHVCIDGLMAIPPFLDDPEAIRPYHRRLAELAADLRKKTGLDLPELSTGMSLDLEQAIEEGATIVRVGTDIFGPRDYSQS